MRVVSIIFWTTLIVIISEIIIAKYLLVDVDLTKDVGMYLTRLQKCNKVEFINDFNIAS